MSEIKKFVYKTRVTEADIDQLNHANNVVYLRWAQDAAEAHWLVLSDADTRNENVWVVVRHEIDYKAPAFLDEELTIQTWVGETAGVRSIRYVDIYSESGKISAMVKTTWCLVDAHTLKPKRINDELAQLFLR